MTLIKEVYNYPNGYTEEVQSLSLNAGQVTFFISPMGGSPLERKNQDSLAVIDLVDNSIVLAVADGAGAHRGGAEASESALKSLIDCLSKSTEKDSIKGVLLDAIDEANKSVIALGVGAATTLVICHISDSGVRSYNIGDSSAVIVGQRGKLKFQTLAHSPVGYAQEAGVLDEETALNHEDRNIVSNLLGIPDMHVQIDNRKELAQKDTVLLASDGVFDNLRVEEMIDIIRKGNAKKALSELVQKTSQRMTAPEAAAPSKDDDVSMILFRKKST